MGYLGYFGLFKKNSSCEILQSIRADSSRFYGPICWDDAQTKSSNCAALLTIEFRVDSLDRLPCELNFHMVEFQTSRRSTRAGSILPWNADETANRKMTLKCSTGIAGRMIEY
jgi:hypothetical protein